MQEVYDRVCEWNEKRFPRKFDKAANLKMLREEYNEWIETQRDNDPIPKQWKELADIIFVAMGALWKYGATARENAYAAGEAVNEVTHLLHLNQIDAGFYIGSFIDVMECDEQANMLACLHMIIALAQAAMYSDNGLTNFIQGDHLNSIMFAVCDSNDSKPLVKVEANEKVAKGSEFVPAEPVLESIYNMIRGKVN